MWFVCEILFHLTFDAMVEGVWKVVSGPFREKPRKETPPVL